MQFVLKFVDYAVRNAENIKLSIAASAAEFVLHVLRNAGKWLPEFG
ncbi:hypothetical protein [Daejeonella lutea]